MVDDPITYLFPQGWNFKHHLMHMLKCLGVQTCMNPLYPQLDGMVEQCIKTVMEENSAYSLTCYSGLLLTECDRTTVNHVANLKDRLHNIHQYKCQHLKFASERMKEHYGHLAHSTGFHV
jgi:hypothetical protein